MIRVKKVEMVRCKLSHPWERQRMESGGNEECMY